METDEKMLVVRTKVAKEIVQTETSYIKALKTLVTDFLFPIQTEGLLKPKDLSIIFSNVEDILNLHASVLSDLERCINNWTDTSCFGTTFMALVAHLKLYKEYCQNFVKSTVLLQEKLSGNSKFTNFVNTSKELHQLDLPSLLIQPIQRIPRYRLLFIELVKHTPDNHPDKAPAIECLSKVEEIASYVNESIREKENQDKLLAIQQSLIGTKIPPILSESRKFMREGTLVKMCRREPKRRYFFLFNDLLVYCSMNDVANVNVPGIKSYTFHRAISLDQCYVEDIPDTGNGLTNAFQVLSNQKSFAVFAESAEIKAQWMADIRHAIQLCYEMKHKSSPGGATSVAPVWVPDKLLKNCMLCDVKFTTITRRHHCRKCGKLVCGSCSNKKFKLENIGKVCRVCDECYDELNGIVRVPSTGSRINSSPNLPGDMAEAQASLARRATQKFRNEDKLATTTNLTSYLPPSQVKASATSSPRASGPLPSSSSPVPPLAASLDYPGPSTPEIHKLTREHRSSTIDEVGIRNKKRTDKKSSGKKKLQKRKNRKADSESESSEGSFDEDLSEPNWPPPEPPALIEYVSDDDEDLEVPDYPPPLPPISV